jgi:hypothetical protein
MLIPKYGIKLSIENIYTGRVMNNINSRELSKADLPQWNALVDHSSHGTIFHKTGWLDACARALEKKVKIFGCFQDGNLVGGCSFFLERKLGVFPIALSICELTPYGGFVLSTCPSKSIRKQETFSREIIESLLGEIKKERYFTIVINNSPTFLEIRPFSQNNWRSRILYTYYINLDNNLESHIDQSAKKNIRKAEKSRIIIEPFSDISRYYTLLCDTHIRKNLNPPPSKRLLTELYSFIKDQNCGEMMVAKTPDDEIACADIVLWDARSGYSLTAASDARFLSSGSRSLLLINILKRMQERGIPKMDIRMANIPQLSKFASRFNPKLVPYYRIQSWIFDDILSIKI